MQVGAPGSWSQLGRMPTVSLGTFRSLSLRLPICTRTGFFEVSSGSVFDLNNVEHWSLLNMGGTENRGSNPRGCGTFPFLRAATTGEVIPSPER